MIKRRPLFKKYVLILLLIFNCTTDNNSLNGEIVQYKVSFNSQGGSIVSEQTINQNGTVKEPEAPIRLGYTFEGWFKESDCITQWLFNKDIITDNTTLYAKWRINKYTITYNRNESDSGIPPNPVTYEYKTIVTTQSNFGKLWKKGQIFVGWNTKKDGFGRNYSTGSRFLMEASDLELYAKWIRPGTMVLIESEGNHFLMGSDQGIPRYGPIHKVNFTYNFWMDSTEVTQKDYSQLMKSTYFGYTDPPWQDSYGKGDKYPVYFVNWYNAALYCNARSKRDGLDTIYSYMSITVNPEGAWILDSLKINYDKKGYRLPTEAEWEYACRSGTTTEFYWGADTAGIEAYAWFIKNSGLKAHEVATKPSNTYRLYDMYGNVIEWCNDWESSYTIDAQTDPTGPDIGNGRIVRDGSWRIEALYCRSAHRSSFGPKYSQLDLGFRVIFVN